ncbi:hypothetical protein GQF42_07150 [Streptomyces broussonetiae]|uniref:Uncharacterized protein n=1 Tax=Streptomyces broussonetiae TaxID=2686304 RepID=A0A6I6MUG3_9ACTN|nr:DUF6214 family protein [Streptomyces broussonetiae]QHA03082.1 hypothetical protein GQF42_07150 [Streptomyces broussonetiae]
MSVWPAWEVREHGGTLSWFHVRLAFPDGAGVDALAVVCGGHVSIEDVRAEPALSLADLTALADWIQGPLFASCGVAEQEQEQEQVEGMAQRPCGADERSEGERADERRPDADGGTGSGLCAGARRARPTWPRGVEGRRWVAREYRAAQEEGADPVLAVMSATGHSRRRSLRLIARARDAGFLTARHARRA